VQIESDLIAAGLPVEMADDGVRIAYARSPGLETIDVLARDVFS
jgi:hypothetical protein